MCMEQILEFKKKELTARKSVGKSSLAMHFTKSQSRN